MSAPEWDFLGLPIETLDEDAEISSPLAVVVIVKALDSDGDIYYRARASEGLSTVEAYGMAGYAVERLRRSFGSHYEDD